VCVFVELHDDTALNDGCNESGFEVDYPFTGLGYALKYTKWISSMTYLFTN